MTPPYVDDACNRETFGTAYSTQFTELQVVHPCRRPICWSSGDAAPMIRCRSAAAGGQTPRCHLLIGLETIKRIIMSRRGPTSRWVSREIKSTTRPHEQGRDVLGFTRRAIGVQMARLPGDQLLQRRILRVSLPIIAGCRPGPVNGAVMRYSAVSQCHVCCVS